MGKLMATFNRLEEGRKRDVGEEGGALGLGLRRPTTAASILARGGRNRARDLALEVRGEVRWLGEGSGLKNGGETAGATSGGKRWLCFACRLRAGARREKKERRNGVSLVTWWHCLSGDELPRHGDAWRRRRCVPPVP